MRAISIFVLTAFARAAAAEEPVDAEQWLRARHVQGEIDPSRAPFGCREVLVGKPRETALLCTEVEEVSAGSKDEPVYRVITHQTLTIVRASTAITVLDAETTLQSFDANPGMPAILALALHIAPDGLSATIAPTDRDICKNLRAGKDAWERFDFEIERRMCKARGTYAWRNGRFRRKS